MANSIICSLLEQGPRNAVVKVTGQVDSPVALTKIVDVLALNGNPEWGWPHPDRLRLDHINYSIQDGLGINLWWEGSPNLPIAPLAGRGRINPWDFGGMPDDALKYTGNVLMDVNVSNTVLSTFVASSGLFTLILEFVKKYKETHSDIGKPLPDPSVPPDGGGPTSILGYFAFTDNITFS